MTLTVRSLGVDAWDQFAELAERNNGSYGGPPEQLGFDRLRQVGRHAWIVRRVGAPA